MSIELWEIMVPVYRKDGKTAYTVKEHRAWDKKVREIAGGLTVMKPAKGQWVSDSGTLYAEKMIPVRIACRNRQMDDILEMTRNYYEQEKVMFYLVSKQVYFYPEE